MLSIRSFLCNSSKVGGIARGAAVVIAGLGLTSCQKRGLLDPKGPVGRQEEQIIFDSAEVMLAIGIPTILLVLFAAFWFRKSNKRAAYRPDWTFSGRLELLTWMISLMAILVLSSYAFIGSFKLDPGRAIAAEKKTVEIDVVALQWKWLFINKNENIATVNELVIPVDTPVLFRITSEDLMTSFFIPQLGSQIYAMSGMANRLNLEADEIGEYRGIAAHYNGAGFSDMHFQTRSVSEADYAKYVAETKANSAALDTDAYNALREVNASADPQRYGSVEDGLFLNIVNRKVPHGEGGETQQ